MSIRDRFRYLSVGLSARIVIDTLVGFHDNQEVWHDSAKGIETITEVRKILIHLNEKDNTKGPWLFWRNQFKIFTGYDEMILLKEVCEGMKWDTWENDLEQWLLNKDKVMDYFMRLEEAIGRCKQGGCF